MNKLIHILIAATFILTFFPPAVSAHTVDDPMVIDLLAGQYEKIGNVEVWNDGEYLYVKFISTADCFLELHLQVDEDSFSPDILTKKGNPIPGRFEKSSSGKCFTEYLFVYSLANEGFAIGDSLVIATHTALGNGETAWGCGDDNCFDFEGNNWATYFTYTVQGCEVDPGLVNGGFESPVVNVPQNWNIYASGTPGLGWTVEWADSYAGAPDPANLEFHRGAGNWSSRSGDQHAELDTDWQGPGGTNGEEASVKISQDINTCAGFDYTLSYSWSPRPGHDENVLKVYVDGLEVGSHAASGSGNSDTVWTDVTVNFKTTGSTATIEFVEAGIANTMGMFLDNVSVSK